MFPDLFKLDLQDNQITGGLDFLQNMELLAEIDLRGNPISVRGDVIDEVIKLMPRVDMFNDEKIKEPGEFYRKENEVISKKFRDEMIGDIEEVEDEEDTFAQYSGAEDDDATSEKILNPIEYKKKQLKFNKILDKAKAQQAKTNNLISNAEKEFGAKP